MEEKEEKLNDFIISLIGNRPIDRDYMFDHLCAYYFLDKNKRDRLRETVRTRLYFGVFCDEIHPTYFTLPSTLEVVLKDCFGDETALLILEEIDFRELSGCNEEKLVIANYSAGIELRIRLIQSLNALLAKIENARRKALATNNLNHTVNYGY